jgi:hypothetical protein
MPLQDPRPDDPEVIAQFLAYGANRACLRRPPVIHGTPFDEVRTWCPKTRQWKVWPVLSRGDWSLILRPVETRFLGIAN